MVRICPISRLCPVFRTRALEPKPPWREKTPESEKWGETTGVSRQKTGYGARMARKDMLLLQLREMAGTPAEMAAAVGVEASDRSFSRAISDLVAEGVLVPEGSTRDRSYSNAAAARALAAAAFAPAAGVKLVEAPPDVDAALLALVPCSARHFSDEGSRLIADPKLLGATKLALGIETYKGEDGRWYCRHVPGYGGPAAVVGQRQARVCPKCQRREFGEPGWTCPEHGVAVDQPDV
jgi:hypothetical protein